MSFKVSFSTRWADFDPNNHMRHTAYNDYAAESRVRLFNKYGLSLTEFNTLNVGPVLFREETNFLKEIALGDDITVEVFLKGSSERGERFKFKHKIYRGDGTLAAEIEIFAAWMDLKIRKLTDPPKIIMDVFSQLDKTADYELIPLKEK
jgi:acyl-CoA thioester hydrolase